MARQSRFRSTWNWLARRVASLFQFGWPIALFLTQAWFYEHAFFPFALWLWGPIWGALIPSMGALVINVFVFWLYDYMKVDWLKAQALRELADKKNKSRLEKLVTWHLKPRHTLWQKLLGELRFTILLIPIDPVIAAIYYRENHFNGLGWRDWLLLGKATIVACMIWLLIMEPLVAVIKYIWSSVS